MEKLEVLTKKLYEEGIERANREAETIVQQAQTEAERKIAEAQEEAERIRRQAENDVAGLKKKAESEMVLSARQALTELRQKITNLVSGEVAGEMARIGFEDKAFVQELLILIIKKWEVASGNLNLDVILPAEEKERFEAFVAKKYKELLNKGLEIHVGDLKEGFVLQPKDGSYQIGFSEELFEAFFNQYIRSFTKSLLYK